MSEDIHSEDDLDGVGIAIASLKALQDACLRAAEALSEPLFPWVREMVEGAAGDGEDVRQRAAGRERTGEVGAVSLGREHVHGVRRVGVASGDQGGGDGNP